MHVHPSGDELNSVYTAALPILSTPLAFFESALAALTPPAAAPWAAATAAAHAAYLAHTAPTVIPGDVQMAEIVSYLDAKLGSDAVLTNGAGNYSGYLHRFYKFKDYGTQLAPTSGSMGYGLPAAVAAKIRWPERQVVCFAGDGCFLMHGQVRDLTVLLTHFLLLLS